jgi:hypothetical protein
MEATASRSTEVPSHMAATSTMKKVHHSCAERYKYVIWRTQATPSETQQLRNTERDTAAAKAAITPLQEIEVVERQNIQAYLERRCTAVHQRDPEGSGFGRDNQEWPFWNWDAERAMQHMRRALYPW